MHKVPPPISIKPAATRKYRAFASYRITLLEMLRVMGHDEHPAKIMRLDELFAKVTAVSPARLIQDITVFNADQELAEIAAARAELAKREAAVKLKRKSALQSDDPLVPRNAPVVPVSSPKPVRKTRMSTQPPARVVEVIEVDAPDEPAQPAEPAPSTEPAEPAPSTEPAAPQVEERAPPPPPPPRRDDTDEDDGDTEDDDDMESNGSATYVRISKKARFGTLDPNMPKRPCPRKCDPPPPLIVDKKFVFWVIRRAEFQVLAKHLIQTGYAFPLWTEIDTYWHFGPLCGFGIGTLTYRPDESDRQKLYGQWPKGTIPKSTIDNPIYPSWKGADGVRRLFLSLEGLTKTQVAAFSATGEVVMTLSDFPDITAKPTFANRVRCYLPNGAAWVQRVPNGQGASSALETLDALRHTL